MRGTLNKPNPYGLIKKDGQDIYVQRTLVKDIQDKYIPSIIDEMIKTRIYDLKRQNGDIKLDKLKQDGVIVLPEYNYVDKKGKPKLLKEMVLRKIRLKAYKQSQYSLKEIRKMDQSAKEYKRDIYVLKEKDSNYEAIIYGDLVPNERGKLNREYRLINHFNIVKNVFTKEPSLPILFKIHTDDMFLIFNKHFDEINWEDYKDLQCRLFKSVKFNENEILIFERHNYADGDADHAPGISEEKLKDMNGVVLRRRASTFKGIPTKVDELGRIDIEYSKNFIEKHLQQ